MDHTRDGVNNAGQNVYAIFHTISGVVRNTPVCGFKMKHYKIKNKYFSYDEKKQFGNGAFISDSGKNEKV